MYTNECEITVRYVETDQMGVVHHSNYYHWFEVARSEFLKITGYTYYDLEKQGLLIPLVESYCKYKVGAKYGDDVIIYTTITDIKNAKIIFNYKVARKIDNIILAEGKTVHAFVNNNFKIINMKKIFPNIFNKLSKLV